MVDIIQSLAAHGAGLKPITAIDFAGDSRTQQAIRSLSNTNGFTARFAGFGLAAAGYPVQMLTPQQFGVGGDTSVQLLARWAAVLAGPGDTTCILIGINDNNLLPGAVGVAGSTIDNIHQMIMQTIAAGKRIILCNETPRMGVTSAQAITDTLARVAWLSGAEAYYTSLGYLGKVLVADTWNALLDQQTALLSGYQANGYGVATGTLDDGAGGTGNVLTITTLAGGTSPLQVGTGIYINKVFRIITALGTGTGAAGTYTVNGAAALVTSGTMGVIGALLPKCDAVFNASISGNTLTLNTLINGSIAVGQQISGAAGGSMAPAVVTALASGTANTAGATYTISGAAQTQASQTTFSNGVLWDNALHPNARGGYLMGLALARAITRGAQATSYARPYRASDNTISLNGNLSGTGGTVGSGVTGNLPDNFALVGTSSSAATATLTRTVEGAVNWLSLAVGGTAAAAANAGLTLQQTIPLALPVGAKFDARARVRLLPGSYGIRGINILASSNGGATFLAYSTYSEVSQLDMAFPEFFDLDLWSLPCTVGAGYTSLTFGLNIDLIPNSAISATVMVSGLAAKLVP